eukprot:9377024-Lingulodinium_polyedra.AAC.1
MRWTLDASVPACGARRAGPSALSSASLCASPLPAHVRLHRLAKAGRSCRRTLRMTGSGPQ